MLIFIERKGKAMPNDKTIKFLNWIKSIAIYLLNSKASYCVHTCSWRDFEYINSIYTYDKYILKKQREGGSFFFPMPNTLEYICIAGSKGEPTNPYVKLLIETIFPLWEHRGFYHDSWSYHGVYYTDKSFPYELGHVLFSNNCIPYTEYIDSAIKREIPLCWRDDIRISSDIGRKFFKAVAKKLSKCNFRIRAYCIFWNLFLLSLNDEIYYEQTSDVMTLASILGFNEAMMRDWCNAVEYVLAGNLLSENCDLQCETIEGNTFFLHQNTSELVFK